MLTICIKTIRRPHFCIQTVQSILEQTNMDVRIYVLDDGDEGHRVVDHYPQIVGMVDDYMLTDFNIGLPAGRNMLVNSVQTNDLLMMDDDDPLRSSLDEWYDNYKECGLDLLAAGDHPHLFKHRHRKLYIRRMDKGFWGPVRICDIARNMFIASTDKVKKVLWNPDLLGAEHVDFFLRWKRAGYSVGTDVTVQFESLSPDPPNYTELRNVRNYAGELKATGFYEIHWKKDARGTKYLFPETP